jgi:hypothetical protein
MLESATEPGVLLWQIDATGQRFGHVLESGADTAEADVAEVEWPSALERWQAPLGSVTVLLDPAPSRELRASVRELVQELESRNPGMSAHVVVLLEPLGPIAHGKDLVAALERLYKVTAERRNREDLHALVRWESPGFLPGWGPDCAILPVAGDSTHFFLVGDGQQPIWSWPEHETSVSRLGRDELAAHLPATHTGWVWILVPADASEQARADLSGLFHELTTGVQGSSSAPMITLWPWRAGAAELEDEDSVRDFLALHFSGFPPLP